MSLDNEKKHSRSALKPFDTVTDFITGKEVPNIGAEENRQALEKFLVHEKGFLKEDIEVDADIELSIGDDSYRSQIDLVVSVDGRRFMAIKCAAGSLNSREREILSASRVLEACPLVLSAVSDGETAIVMCTVSGEKKGKGLKSVPSREEARQIMSNTDDAPLPEARIEKEKLIFRAYDLLNVNVQRNIR